MTAPYTHDNLALLTKKELVSIAESSGLKVKPQQNKHEIATAIIEAYPAQSVPKPVAEKPAEKPKGNTASEDEINAIVTGIIRRGGAAERVGDIINASYAGFVTSFNVRAPFSVLRNTAEALVRR